jgi:hypothetical protein
MAGVAGSRGRIAYGVAPDKNKYAVSPSDTITPAATSSGKKLHAGFACPGAGSPHW